MSLTLTSENTLPILIKYIELSQSKGAFLLTEADILKRAVDVLTSTKVDKDIDKDKAKTLLIQAVNKGQLHGDYTLNDASLLFNVVQYVTNNDVSMTGSSSSKGKEKESGDDFDLSELSEPIPLRNVKKI